MIRIIEWAAFVRGGCFDGTPSALTVGVFDGVHRGHRALISRLSRLAAEHSLLPAAVTFRRPPRRLLFPQDDAPDIITPEEKIALFEEASLAACVIIDFAEDVRAMSGPQFIDTLRDKGNMRRLVIGDDFRCGKDGAFNAAAIRARLEQPGGVFCDIVPPVLDEGRPISSSRIRAALRAGDTALAGRLLGRPLGKR